MIGFFYLKKYFESLAYSDLFFLSDCVIFNFDMLLLYNRVRNLGNDDWAAFHGEYSANSDQLYSMI